MNTVRVETHFGAADGLTPYMAAQIAECASQYQADLSIETKGRAIRIESLISILSIELHRGVPLAIIAEGSDADTAVETMRKLIEG